MHPGGNPHIHLDPRNVGRVAVALGERMAVIDPPNGTLGGEGGLPGPLARCDRALGETSSAAQGRADHHTPQNMTYLVHWLGMREVDASSPSPACRRPPHLSAACCARRRSSSFAPRTTMARPAEWLGERAKLPAVTLPYTVGGADKAKDLFGVYRGDVSAAARGPPVMEDFAILGRRSSRDWWLRQPMCLWASRC